MRRKIVTLTGVVATIAAALVLSSCSALIPLIQGQTSEPEIPAPVIQEGGSGLDRFTKQTVQWADCGDGFECAYIAAPLDWDNPSGETIELYASKKPASSKKLGTLFVNPGGPGSGGASYIRESLGYAVSDRLQESYDIIGWDPRGVGESSAVFCLTDDELDEELFGKPDDTSSMKPGSDEWIAAYREDAREFGQICLEGTGPLLEHVDTESTARDLDLLRELSGDTTLNYLGYSYGSFLGTMYAEAFPGHVGRMVLDGAIAPDVTLHEVVLKQQQGFELATRAYLEACSTRESCPFTGSVDENMKTIGAILDRFDEQPVEATDGRWVGVDTLLTGIITALYNEGSWPILDDLFAEVFTGEIETALYLADFYFGREYGKYIDNSTVAFAAINCLDYPRGASVKEMRKQAALIEEAAPIYGKYSGYGDLSCAEWPFAGFDDRGPMHAKGAAPILVIGTTGDPATPYEWAERLADQLESGVLVTMNGEGHTAYASGNDCINTAVDDFFVQGTVPTRDPQC